MEDVLPVADSVVTLRIVDAVRRSVAAMRLKACHMSSGSSGRRVTVPEPCRTRTSDLMSLMARVAKGGSCSWRFECDDCV